MNSESVDLIATDPPFNKGRDFHATPDSLADGASFQDRWSWDKDVHQEWVDKITDDFPKVMNVIQGSRNSYGDDMGAFLCFMAVRLLEMRRVLRETGGVYLHCDPTAGHYLKELMDSIFGYKNFENEIVWCYKSGGASNKRFAKKHDLILFYSKNRRKKQFNVLKEKSYNRDFKPYRFEGIHEYQDEKGWYTLVGMKDYWNIDMVGRTSSERYGYPTQKPLAVYKRIVEASSNEKEIVLDPFCGCATTLVAAEQLNRQWVGIDIWDEAFDAVITRLQKEGWLEGPGGNKGGLLFTEGEILHVTTLPERTDDGQEAVPFLKTKLKVDEPKGLKMSRAEIMAFLLDQHGNQCQGCYRVFDDHRYLELDHNTPRSDGGLNHISNRVLLCGPCNKLKRNYFTLSGLRKENKRLGYMKGS
ncbi:MAG: hypothetical protein F4201_04520 [Nitrospira sp. SB0677_bin_15]|nr:hypothetical protein [Nitrospira sp. SB0677_bin_15]